MTKPNKFYKRREVVHTSWILILYTVSSSMVLALFVPGNQDWVYPTPPNNCSDMMSPQLLPGGCSFKKLNRVLRSVNTVIPFLKPLRTSGASTIVWGWGGQMPWVLLLGPLRVVLPLPPLLFHSLGTRNKTLNAVWRHHNTFPQQQSIAQGRGSFKQVRRCMSGWVALLGCVPGVATGPGMRHYSKLLLTSASRYELSLTLFKASMLST